MFLWKHIEQERENSLFLKQSRASLEKFDFFAGICKGLNKNRLVSYVSKDTSWISRLLFRRVHAYDILTV